jgi:hypothetical protein
MKGHKKYRIKITKSYLGHILKRYLIAIDKGIA